MYVVGFGEALWDLLPTGKQLGGAPANFAYHVNQLGYQSCVVSAVGKDALGKEILNEFACRGLQYICNTMDYPTGTVEVTLNAEGIPSYEIKEDVSWDYIPFTRELAHLAQQTSAICFGSLAQRSVVTRKTLRAFLEFMPKREKVYKVFDINLRQHFYTHEILEESLDICNVFKINDEELKVFCQMFGYKEKNLSRLSRRILTDYHIGILMLTCGTSGSYIFTSQTESFLPTPSVEVVDTVGAGDAFTAAFIAALLQGKTIEESHQQAVAVSAYVCTQQGAMPALPRDFIADKTKIDNIS